MTKGLGRTSHEVRGLKWLDPKDYQVKGVSHLTRGAWIEIETGTKQEVSS